MSDYTPPVEDLRFVLEHVADLEGVAKLPGYGHADPDTVTELLEAYGQFVSEVLAPLDRVGDTHGSVLNPDGTVTTPPGFREAYARYVEAGWGAVPFDPVHGGGGFPWVVAVAMQELLTSANMAFSLCPLLTQGAVDMLTHHGSPEQQHTYLEPMVRGAWTGTMNLTEPQAGSDVGAVRTRAVRADDGTYRITGQKIFITYGEHDLTDQIVHIVLARTPDAPPGTKGISCFIVPKRLVNPDGSLGGRNGVTCVSLEHKMGIHASPTCVLDYDDAVGYLIGEEQRGMRYMFMMMNTARLSVGLEGVAIGERAYQQAAAFARERRQGRPPGAPATEMVPIIEHPDVRRMLLTMRALNEAGRCLVLTNGRAIDVARRAPEASDREAAQDLADLLTPITKGWCTDNGNLVASLAVQVHGGMGYIEETGVAQRYRDIRIAAIYEGTNGIQAIDLVMRKLPRKGGEVVARLLADLAGVAAECGSEELAGACATAERVSRWLGERLAAGAVDDVLAGATPYLRLMGTLCGGGLLARSAVAARRLLDRGVSDPVAAGRLEDKIAVAEFYLAELLGEVEGLAAAVTAGCGLLDAIPTARL